MFGWLSNELGVDQSLDGSRCSKALRFGRSAVGRFAFDYGVWLVCAVQRGRPKSRPSLCPGDSVGCRPCFDGDCRSISPPPNPSINAIGLWIWRHFIDRCVAHRCRIQRGATLVTNPGLTEIPAQRARENIGAYDDCAMGQPTSVAGPHTCRASGFDFCGHSGGADCSSARSRDLAVGRGLGYFCDFTGWHPMALDSRCRCTGGGKSAAVVDEHACLSATAGVDLFGS